MALGLGKLTILVGAGILGSVLAKEGRMPSISDFVSGALKIALKPTRQNDSASSASKPKYDALSSQVNSLRQELQLLSSSRPVTIVTSSATGGRRYGLVVIIIIIGYGYVWWKGWKLPDLSFATKRSLSDACSAVAKQLEEVYSSISATKRNLSSKMDRVESGLDDVAEQKDVIGQEVTQLREDVGSFHVNIESVRHAVRTLETQVHRIEGNEDILHSKVRRLVGFAQNSRRSRSADLQATPSSALKPALEHPQLTPSSRTASLPPLLPSEPPSPSTSNGLNEVQQPLKTAVSAAGLKDLQGMAEAAKFGGKPVDSNDSPVSEGMSKFSNLGSYGRMLFASSSFLSRSRSATQPK
ncbi:hypothetical protein Nepgr_029264 [Nepenthes gracilis]|uniref:DUF1664 domain-containing protein n=1 Tax=Nepenthes gracilis TaxID=150966 RepID=A0AAD3Y5D4_NEPGR|nr:hypothetical protein Nepgr_029264 [Nepenthes gracilis]